jgi:FAD/FMN-containing dehydrogenase
MWGDLYDYATRVEYLGIGVFGSPKSAPNWTTEEVGNAFLRVLDGGQESSSIKESKSSWRGREESWWSFYRCKRDC